MNILLSTDDNYVMPTGVLMTSIGETNGCDVAYFIMTDSEFSDESRAALTRVASKYGNSISFYTITPEMTRSLPFGRDNQPHHVSIATYYRLFITELLPHDVHRILYLDGDVIVRKPLSDLWKTDLEGYSLGVVHDMDERKHCAVNRLPYSMEKGYFNAGVLFINLDYWRTNRCFESFKNFINENSNIIRFHDQDVLNSVFSDSCLYLPFSYNMQSGFLYREDFLQFDRKYVADINLYKYDPCIVHYCAPDKPWHLECYHTFCKDWRKYFFMTEWRNIRLKGEEDRPTLSRKLRNYLVKHCWYVPATLYQKTTK